MAQRNLNSTTQFLYQYSRGFEKSNLKYFLNNFQRISSAITKIGSESLRKYTPISQILDKNLKSVLVEERYDTQNNIPLVGIDLHQLIEVNENKFSKAINKAPPGLSDSVDFKEEAVASDDIKVSRIFETIDHITEESSASLEIGNKNLELTFVARLVLASKLLAEYLTETEQSENSIPNSDRVKRETNDKFINECAYYSNCISRPLMPKELSAFHTNIAEYTSLGSIRGVKESGSNLEDVFSLSLGDAMVDSGSTLLNRIPGYSSTSQNLFLDDQVLPSKMSDFSSLHQNDRVSAFLSELEYSLDYFNKVPSLESYEPDYLVNEIKQIIARSPMTESYRVMNEQEPLHCVFRNDVQDSLNPVYCTYIDECTLTQERNLQITEGASDIIDSDVDRKVHLPQDLLK